MYPVMLFGANVRALVVGGGDVAARKTRALLDGGVRVTVVAPEVGEELTAMAAASAGLSLVRRAYAREDVEQPWIVIAATNDAAVNAAVARDALALRRLVNVVDDPEAGNFVTPAVHRSGDLTLAVSTGRMPAAAAAIRAELARRFDGRYARAIQQLRALRERLLGGGQRDEWTRASRDLVGDDFCEAVEQGTIDERVATWR